MAAWYEEVVSPDLTYDGDNGVKLPVRDHPFVRESPDLGHFVNKSFAQHRAFGGMIPVNIEKVRNADGTFAPKAEAVEKWHKDNLPKLYDAGILDRPLAKAEDYKVDRPADLPEGLTWSDENTGKLRGVLHKYKIPQAAVPELMELHKSALLGASATLKTDMDAALAELRAEHKEKFDERMEQSKRLTKVIFKNKDEVDFLESTGIANHPAFLSVMMRLAAIAASDSSFGLNVEQQGTKQSGDEVRAQLADIMNNTANPKHALWLRGDPALMKEIDEMYKKTYGTAQVTI